jgi:RNA polymerase sigma factor (sigma-70 family)
MSMFDTSGQVQRSVPDLVFSAQAGDERAWVEIVERFEPLVGAIARKYHLARADVDEVKQSVWLKLFSNIDDLRRPEALPGWIATTTAHACVDVIKHYSRCVPVDTLVWEGPHAKMAWVSVGEGEHQPADVDVERDEVRRIVRRGLAELTPAQRQLLLHVVAEPPLSYAQIGSQLQIPVGSIGPTRARCLQKLRNTDALREMENSAARRVA